MRLQCSFQRDCSLTDLHSGFEFISSAACFSGRMFELLARFAFAVSSLMKTLQRIRDDNALLEHSIDRMTQRRDQLLALKARLSVPFHTSSMNSSVVANQDLRFAEARPFQPLPAHTPPHSSNCRLPTSHAPHDCSS